MSIAYGTDMTNIPEGYKRKLYNDSSIIFSGAQFATLYQSSKYENSIAGKITIKCVCTAFALAVNGDTAGLRYDVKVVVDGEQKGIISQAMTAFSQAVMRCFFSIENLEEKEHIIEIVCADTSGSKYWGIGAFDYVGRTEIEILSDKVLLLQNQVSNVYTKSEIDAKLQNISVGNINLDEYAKVADILTLLMGYETVSDLTIVLSQYQKVSDMLTLLNDYQRVSDIVNEHAGLATKEELQQFRSEILQSGNVVMFQNNDEIVKKLSAIAEILVLK